MLPVVDFCGLEVSRLVLGANPFGGYSHQTAQRNDEMVAYYTVERIVETWGRAESAGVNTFITNNETPPFSKLFGRTCPPVGVCNG